MGCTDTPLQGSRAIVKTFSYGELGQYTGGSESTNGIMYQAFKKYAGHNNYKVSRME